MCALITGVALDFPTQGWVIAMHGAVPGKNDTGACRLVLYCQLNLAPNVLMVCIP